MRKTILSVVLVLCMVVSMVLPNVCVSAADEPKELYLGGVNVLENPEGKGPDGGSYSYDASASTLTLTDYIAEGKNYHKISIEDNITTAAYLYTTLGALRIKLKGNCRLGNEKVLDEYINDSKTVRTMGIVNTSNSGYIYIENSDSEKPGTLTVNVHCRPILTCYAYTSAKAVSLNCAMDGLYVLGNFTVITGEVKMTSNVDGKLVYYGAKIDGQLYVGKTANVTVTSNGVAYQSSYPKALLAGEIDVNEGKLVVKSQGTNSSDGCQGRAIDVGTLSIEGEGRVEAYSHGKNTQTNLYDGREAVYIKEKLTLDSNASLYAENLNTDWDNDNVAAYGAIRFAKGAKWEYYGTGADGSSGNNISVVTSPAGAYYMEEYGTILEEGIWKSARKVEICGIRKSILTLSRNDDGQNTWRYRSSNGSVSSDDDSTGQVYSGVLNLNEGYESTFGKIGNNDYNGFYGIDVRKGEHDLILGHSALVKDNTYITVRSGATLNISLDYEQYLEYKGNGNMPVISVESGGTLNITGKDWEKTCITIKGGDTVIAAQSGATVKFNNCTLYTDNGIIGGTNADVYLENCWVKADFEGNLRIKTSNVTGKHQDNNIWIDNASNVNLTTAEGKAPTGVKDHSDTPVYRTVVQLEKVNQNSNKNKSMIVYRDGDKGEKLKSVILPQITELRYKLNGIPITLNNVKLFTGGESNEELYLWLGNGTAVENIYGYDDGTATAVGYIYEAPQNTAIVTDTSNNTCGTMILRNLLLTSGVFALKGTTEEDNTKLCGGYQGNSSDNWIDYDPSKDIKIMADTTVVAEFGIHILQDSRAEVKLDSLNLVGKNKRVVVDDGSELTLMIYDINSMKAVNDDAVWNITGSLIVKSATEAGRMTLGGSHAISGSSTGKLTITDSVITSECTDKTTPAVLGALTITNSTVTGLGMIDSDNIIIDGGSVDLDVPEGKYVKNSEGRILEKQTYVFPGKNNIKVDDLTITGMPEGSSFNADNIITDNNGKITVWLPAGAEVTGAVLGNTIYYTKKDGNMTSGEAASFTSPSEDITYVLQIGERVDLSVVPEGTPEPVLQWQRSIDGGRTWTDIEGANGAAYEAEMTLENACAKFRCVASNRFGDVDYNTVSNVFNLYYKPNIYGDKNNDGISYYRGNGNLLILNGCKAPMHVIVSNLDQIKGCTANYQWMVDEKGDGNWTAIEGADTDRIETPVVDSDMNNIKYQCNVTLNYMDGKQISLMPITFNICVVEKPAVEGQPDDQILHEGETATFSVLNELKYFTYFQWQVCTDGSNWVNIEGAIGNSYTVPDVTYDMDNFKYRCIVGNSEYNLKNENISNPVVLRVAGTVRFDCDGGTDVKEKTDVLQDEKVLAGVTAPVKSGWKFIGWKCDGMDVNEDTTYSRIAGYEVDKAVTLTAQWEAEDGPDSPGGSKGDESGDSKGDNSGDSKGDNSGDSKGDSPADVPGSNQKDDIEPPMTGDGGIWLWTEIAFIGVAAFSLAGTGSERKRKKLSKR